MHEIKENFSGSATTIRTEKNISSKIKNTIKDNSYIDA
jgi:hypothetical protein